MVTPNGDCPVNREDHAGENDTASNVTELYERSPRTQNLYRGSAFYYFSDVHYANGKRAVSAGPQGSMAAPTEALSQSWKKHCANVPASRSSRPSSRTSYGRQLATWWRPGTRLADRVSGREWTCVQVRELRASMLRKRKNASPCKVP